MKEKFLTEKEFQLLKDTLNNNEYENKDKRINKPTPLEALDAIARNCDDIRYCDEEFWIVAQSLKALEIIKDMFNDKVDITELLTYIELDKRANRSYEDSPFKKFYKKEEYELLKEVLL